LCEIAHFFASIQKCGGISLRDGSFSRFTGMILSNTKYTIFFFPTYLHVIAPNILSGHAISQRDIRRKKKKNRDTHRRERC